jgi:P4 family phage/plasmid primase-like protien
VTTSRTPREIAGSYLDQGWVTVPVPIRKKVGPKGWADRTRATSIETFEQDFGTKPQNIAILLGEPSGGLVDVDLDCPEAIDLAPAFLPPTRTFGRASKPASHWVYTCRHVQTAKYPEPVEFGVKSPMLVELRGNRCLTVFPGSVHECGEHIEWSDESTRIANVEAALLYKSVARLAVACLLVRQGMAREAAIDTAMADGGSLIDHPCTATVRKWLTGKADRPKPPKEAIGKSSENIDSAVAAFNRANPGDWPKSGGMCPACHHNGCFGAMPDNPTRWVCFSASHTAPGIAGSGCYHGDALDLIAQDTNRTRIEVLIASGYLQPARAPAESLGAEFITDLGTANRFIKRHGQNIRYVRTLRTWFTWDGRSWRPDDTGRAMHLCAEIAREMTIETASKDHKIHKAARQQEQRSRIAGALDLAGVNPVVAARVAELDANPWLLTCKNGTLNLLTGLLHRHERGDLITKVLPHEFDANAACPRWEKFLNEVMDGRPELVDFLHRWSGYCLSADVREQAIVILVGKGCNGKSVFVETLMYVLGPEFATPAPPGLLLTAKGERHPTEVIDLLRRRLVVANEVPKNTAFNEERVKSLAGGDTLKGRPMRGDFVSFKPTHKLALCANHMPRVKDPSPAFWRRLRVVPFDVSFLGRQDKTLVETLRAEAIGILAWMVRGCLAWQAQGLGDTPEIKNATNAYRDAEDLIGQFLADRTPATDVPGRLIYAEYKAWCDENGEKPMPNKGFVGEIERLGWTRRHTKTGNVWSAPRSKGEAVKDGEGDSGLIAHTRARAHDDENRKEDSPAFTVRPGSTSANQAEAASPSSLLREQLGIDLDDFEAICRQCIDRVAPSSAEEDAHVAAQILNIYGKPA